MTIGTDTCTNGCGGPTKIWEKFLEIYNKIKIILLYLKLLVIFIYYLYSHYLNFLDPSPYDSQSQY